MYKIDFNRPIRIHFMGIGGISMSGLAEVLLERGFYDHRFRYEGFTNYKKA